MIVEKPTPEQLDKFLKGLPDDELLELIMTRVHHDNRSPIEFISKYNGSSCGIDNEGYQMVLKEKAGRANAFFKELEASIVNNSLIHKDSIEPILELNRLAAGVVERPFSKRDYPVTAGLDEVNPITLLRNQSIPIVTGGRDARPLVWLDDQNNPRAITSTERFEKFVKEIPIHELFELGDMVVDNPNRRGLGAYHSKALEQSETVFHTDLPRIYGEIKSRFKQMGVVK